MKMAEIGLKVLENALIKVGEEFEKIGEVIGHEF